MSAVFDTWKEAHNAAKEKATRYNLDVAIRKVKEYGKIRFVVSFACRNDSDYARAEIITPNTP